MSSTPGYDPAFASAGTSLAPLQGIEDDSVISSKAARASIPTLQDPANPSKLTPLRAHYLKKTLIRLQMEREVVQLNTKDALSTFGPPFRPSPDARRTDLPLLRFMFQHFVLTFPFLRSAPPNFFADKVQVFFDKFLERNISSTDDRDESTKRRKLTNKLEKYFVLLMGSAIKVKGIGEDVVRISEKDRLKMSAVEQRRKAASVVLPLHLGATSNSFVRQKTAAVHLPYIPIRPPPPPSDKVTLTSTWSPFVM